MTGEEGDDKETAGSHPHKQEHRSSGIGAQRIGTGTVNAAPKQAHLIPPCRPPPPGYRPITAPRPPTTVLPSTTTLSTYHHLPHHNTLPVHGIMQQDKPETALHLALLPPSTLVTTPPLPVDGVERHDLPQTAPHLPPTPLPPCLGTMPPSPVDGIERHNASEADVHLAGVIVELVVAVGDIEAVAGALVPSQT